MRCNLNRIRDEGSAWIRLADAIAGFNWHVYENKPYTQTLFPEMQQKGYIIQLQKKMPECLALATQHRLTQRQRSRLAVPSFSEEKHRPYGTYSGKDISKVN